MNYKKTIINKILVVFLLVIMVALLSSSIMLQQNNIKLKAQAVSDVTTQEDKIADLFVYKEENGIYV